MIRIYIDLFESQIRRMDEIIIEYSRVGKENAGLRDFSDSVNYELLGMVVRDSSEFAVEYLRNILRARGQL